MSKPPPPRVRFAGSQKVPGAPNKIAVRLEVHSKTYQGVAEDEATPEGELRAAARATLEALVQAIRARNPNSDLRFELREIGPFDAFGREGVMVTIMAEWETQSRPLLGFTPGGSDPVRSASLAVLNATNRFVALGPTKSQ